MTYRKWHENLTLPISLALMFCNDSLFSNHQHTENTGQQQYGFQCLETTWLFNIFDWLVQFKQPTSDNAIDIQPI